VKALIAGGGTGGHLFPGIAIAEEVVSRKAGNEVFFVGTRHGIEARVLPELGWPHAFINVRGLKGTGWSSRLRRALLLPTSLVESLVLVRKFRPDVAVGVGGYASGPPLAAARLLGVPCVLLEQNSVPGATNRLLARFSKAVFTTFGDGEAYFPNARVLRLGNPIRRQLLENFLRAARQPSDRFRLLVLGGSQGARGINDLMIGAAPTLRRTLPDLAIVHQTGQSDVDRVAEAYREAGADAEVVTFINDVSGAYRAADLVVCRAGATTLAEVTVAKRASILIPFPHAADNHQERNARDMVDAGAALVLRQSETTPEQLARHILDIACQPERRASMEAAAARMGRPEAAREIVDACEAIIAGRLV
jgi:UDP-N-acetylglucosamine--N-acetylmuramyl-(pentapeptide) pyrophosphoryl-undecaprenol N-acetylglucosamine transferase